MEKKLSFASRYLGLLGSLIKVVTSLSAIKSLKKSAKDSSELKQVKVNQKLTHQYRGLVGRVISVASAILGFVAIAVGAAVIPWVIVALDTLSF